MSKDTDILAKPNTLAHLPDTDLNFAEAVELGFQDLRDGLTLSHEEAIAHFKARFASHP